MQYEVVVVYKGQKSYLVDAKTPADADHIARGKFASNDEPDCVGTEYETVENVVVYDESGVEV